MSHCQTVTDSSLFLFCSLFRFAWYVFLCFLGYLSVERYKKIRRKKTVRQRLSRDSEHVKTIKIHLQNTAWTFGLRAENVCNLRRCLDQLQALNTV